MKKLVAVALGALFALGLAFGADMKKDMPMKDNMKKDDMKGDMKKDMPMKDDMSEKKDMM
nr:hypothetical protein [Campylobacter sp.]